jgi:hypothetical protein
MAAKDADLARDFSLDFVFISNDDVAAFEVSLDTTPKQVSGDRSEELFLTEEVGVVFEIEATATPHGTGAGGTGVTYRMRGFDQNGAVNDYVFWSSSTVDSSASNYAGSAGPVVDIVVHSIVGA